jgi:hypothetical protein
MIALGLDVSINAAYDQAAHLHLCHGNLLIEQIAKCAPLRAAHAISQKRQCRGAASSKGQ